MKWLVIATATCGLIGAGAASAIGEGRIVPQKGIAGVRLGMTQAQVKADIGLPAKVERGNNEIGPYTTYRYRTFTVTFFGGPKVTQLDTHSPRKRTASGVGVSSSRADVRAKVAGIRCLKEFGYHHCYVGSWQPGRVITDFALKNGRVTSVSIGYVID